jgi:hypothetical protein
MKKNKKGQIGVAGYVFLIIGIIVALTLIIASSQQIGTVKDTWTYENVSIGVLTNGTPTYITTCRAMVGTVIIFNATGDVTIPSTNYTLTNNVLYNGMWAVQIDPAVVASADYGYNSGLATIDGTCEPITYSESSTDKTVLDLILILCAIALLVWVADRTGLLDWTREYD